MGVFARDPRREEQPGVGSGLEVDLDVKVCPACRRELHPWEPTCPDDGSTGVERESLQRADLPPPPPELLDE
jgi:hypothetical protein